VARREEVGAIAHPKFLAGEKLLEFLFLSESIY